MPKTILRLYVNGNNERARIAIANLRRICEQELQGQYEVCIIDILDSPDLAESERIMATPTLIRQLPPPLRRIVGDLSETDKVLYGLDLLSTLSHS